VTEGVRERGVDLVASERVALGGGFVPQRRGRALGDRGQGREVVIVAAHVAVLLRKGCRFGRGYCFSSEIPVRGMKLLMSTYASVLVDSFGPPSAEVCRTAASFP
jgi:hypothetical protein